MAHDRSKLQQNISVIVLLLSILLLLCDDHSVLPHKANCMFSGAVGDGCVCVGKAERTTRELCHGSFFLPRPLLPAISFNFSAEEKVSQHLSVNGEERPRTKGDLNIYTCGNAPLEARKWALIFVCLLAFVTSPHPPGGCLTLEAEWRMLYFGNN